MKLLFAIILLLALDTTSVVAQAWQPKTRVWGATARHIIWDIDQKPPLAEIRNGPNGLPSRNHLYNLLTFDAYSVPFDTLPHISYAWMVGDINSDGRKDIAGQSYDQKGGVKILLIVSPFATDETVRPYGTFYFTNNGWTGSNALEDCDGDGINDVMDTRGKQPSHNAWATITYGETDGVWRTQSRVNYSEHQGEGKFEGDDRGDELVCMGMLSGKPVMLRAAYVKTATNEFDSYFKLDLLDTNDLYARRDTVRAQTIQSWLTPGEWATWQSIITFDDVWQVTGVMGPGRHLRITLDEMHMHEGHESFTYTTGYDVFGQSKDIGASRPRFDGSRPFLFYSTNSVNTMRFTQKMELIRIVDPMTLETAHLGTMELAGGGRVREGGDDIGGVFAATLVLLQLK